MDWLTTVAETFNAVVPTAANAYNTVKSADALNHQETSPFGIPYTNGQFSSGATGGVSPLVLLAGAGLMLFLFLKD